MRDVIEQHYVENRDRYINRYKRRVGVHGAEDIVQTAFEWALKWASSYNRDLPLENWFSMLLRNAFILCKRNELPVYRTVEEEDLGVEDSPAFNEHFSREVKDLISTKKEGARNVLYLYFFQNYKPAEIHKVTEHSKIAITMILQRFKQEIRAKYGDESDMRS